MNSIRKRMRTFGSRKLSANTIAELLVVMIVSGILFLLLFDGLDIVRRYGHILDRQLSAKSGLLYSHQVLETLFERTDSISLNEQELLFYSSNAQEAERVYLDSACVLLCRPDYTDTLFAGLVQVEPHGDSPSIDSLFVYVRIGVDTVRLEYGLPALHHLVSNSFNDSYAEQ